MKAYTRLEDHKGNEKEFELTELALFVSTAQEEVIPQFLEECAFNGHYYAIPYMRSTEACYVNKT